MSSIISFTKCFLTIGTKNFCHLLVIKITHTEVGTVIDDDDNGDYDYGDEDDDDDYDYDYDDDDCNSDDYYD